MYQMLHFGQTNSVFKNDAKNSEPFPPSYYENKKRASELIGRMTDPQKLKKKT